MVSRPGGPGGDLLEPDVQWRLPSFLLNVTRLMVQVKLPGFLGATQCKQSHPRWPWNELVAPRNLSQCVILVTYITPFPHSTCVSPVQGIPAVPPLSFWLLTQEN